FGRIAALRIWVKTPSLDPNSRLALHPKRDSLALTPIYEMGSNYLLRAMGKWRVRLSETRRELVPALQ
ncbi:hypothetical protein, partial [Herbaspirillum huttiense]